MLYNLSIKLWFVDQRLQHHRVLVRPTELQGAPRNPHKEICMHRKVSEAHVLSYSISITILQQRYYYDLHFKVGN